MNHIPKMQIRNDNLAIMEITIGGWNNSFIGKNDVNMPDISINKVIEKLS